MIRKLGYAAGALVLIGGLTIFIYGFNPRFPAVAARKLPKSNPTSFVFKASAAEIHDLLKEKTVRCCGRAIEFKEHASFSDDILKLPGNEKDAYIHSFGESIGLSDIYFAGGKQLPYICEFHIHLIPMSKEETKVVVIPYKSKVIEGLSWWGPHNLSPAYIFKSVAPTTIEEYRILLEIGAALETNNMPPLVLPSNGG
jgi:hypothetical protein